MAKRDFLQAGHLQDYARFVEAQARQRATVQGPEWPGSEREVDFFLGAMAIFLFMEQPLHIPDAWMAAIDPMQKLKSVVAPRKGL